MEILQLLQEQSVIRIPNSGPLARQARRAVAAGLAIRPLPGILMAKRVEHDPNAWIFANWLWRPTSIVTGRAVLRWRGQPQLKVPAVDALLPYSFPDHGLLKFHRSSLPGELTDDAGRGLIATPAAASLLLGQSGDWAPICEALRIQAVTVGAIREARELLSRQLDAKAMDLTLRYLSENPWSVAELELHELLRIAGITGWTGNSPVLLNVVDGGRDAIKERFPDAAFEAERLTIEVEGESYHNNSETFAKDILRSRWFAAAGWTRFPVTPKQLRAAPNDFLHNLCSLVHRRHRPASLPSVRYCPEAPFWRKSP